MNSVLKWELLSPYVFVIHKKFHRLHVIVPVNDIILEFSSLFHAGYRTFSLPTSLAIAKSDSVATRKLKIMCNIVHSQKRASCSKSAIATPISGCVRIACSGLMITSLFQVVNRLAASCELHTGLMQAVSSTCSKSANVKLQEVWCSTTWCNLMRSI